MRLVGVLVILSVLVASPAWALQAALSWTNPADPSVTGITIQKASSSAGPFVTVNAAPLPPTVSLFSDPAVSLGSQTCYQVLWQNALGTSAPLGPLCGTPNAPQSGSGLTIIFKP